MKNYIKCEVCGKHLKEINAAHLKTHDNIKTLEEYNQYIQSKKRKRSWKLIPTVIISTIINIIGNLLTPLAKSLLTKISRLLIYLEGLKYKLIIAVLTVTVTSSVVIYKLHQVKPPSPPSKPEIPIETEDSVIPVDVSLDTTEIVLLELPSPPVTALLPFRSQPTSLSHDEMEVMIKKYDFFDSMRNKNGRGFDNDFILLKDGQVVYDRKSGLMWQQSGSDKHMNYEDAKTSVEQLDFAGYNDWRLPTLEEAMSLMERDKKNDGYINSIFDSKQRWIWAADRVKGMEGLAWIVVFEYGACYSSALFLSYNSVRAVRSGQSSQELFER